MTIFLLLIYLAACQKQNSSFDYTKNSVVSGYLTTNKPNIIYKPVLFSAIDFRGKQSYIVPKLCSEFSDGAHSWVNWNEVMTFRSEDYGLIWYEFNKKSICFKIIIKIPIKNPIMFDKSVVYTSVRDKYNIIYTIEK